MRPAGAVAALAVLGASSLLGCAAIHSRQPVPGTAEGEWARVRVAATRRTTLYDGLVHRATATATHLGAAEREARARRLAEWLDWTPQELEQRLAQERTGAEQEDQFVLSFYASDWHVNDLDSPSSVWRVALHVAGAEVLPTKVEAIDADPNVRGLYPFVGDFDVVYLVHFPRTPAPADGGPYLLRISCALGKLDLDYAAKVEPDTVKRPAPGPTAP
ncbi:hypothetical protein [Anaeromyxobacter oryzisoli]|uniref:hypothetical protein n=1 Tax=Anaeromyxobacter oryzisoli TaxID=2925408 RepID=UPI001F598564|nr:hypothetical protein [Anaeromyxobacter sp. SG63]